jgi:hypothetical protein
MHQTTVRFGPDLWEEIEVEAARGDVSVAQFVRDAALIRVAYTRGRDDDPEGRRREARTDAAALRAETLQARRQAKALREQAQQQRADAARSSAVIER